MIEVIEDFAKIQASAGMHQLLTSSLLRIFHGGRTVGANIAVGRASHGCGGSCVKGKIRD